MKNLSILVFTFISLSLWSQTFLEKTIETGSTHAECQNIIPTSDGGLVLVGQRTSGTGPSTIDLLLLKTNQNGDTIWTRSFGIDNVVEVGWRIIETSDLSFVIAATYQHYYLSEGGVLIIKTNSTGHELWSKKFPNLGRGGRTISIITNPAGEFIFTLRTQSTGKFALLKLDPSGNTIWVKDNYPNLIQSGFGVLTTDGELFISGGGSDSNLYPYAIAMRCDASGNLLWSKTFSPSEYPPFPYDMLETPDGNFIITGPSFDSTLASRDVHLTKLAASGKIMWSKFYGGSGEESPAGLHITESNSYLIGGYTHGNNAFLMKVSPYGDSLWTMTFDSLTSKYCNSMCVSRDRRIYMTGTAVDSEVSMWQQPLFIKSIDPDEPPSAPISKISLFPNPNNGNFTLESFAPITKVHIVDAMGRVLFNANNPDPFSQKFSPINVPFLKPGVYTARVYTAGIIYPISFAVTRW